MSANLSFGKIEFNLGTEAAAARGGRDPETPFRLALLGDFSGRASRGVVEPIARRHARVIDYDNCKEVLSGLNASLRLPAQWDPSSPIELRVTSVDDFHPDRLLAQVKPLGALLEKRKALSDPATAAELKTLLGLQPDAAPGLPSPSPATSTGTSESHEETLARLLGGPPTTQAARSPTPSRSGPDINQLIRSIIAPTVVPAVSPEQTALRSALDLELTHQLRAILHHPAWQALEAAWRSVDLLVRQFGAEENLELSLIDISQEELVADLQATEELAGTGTCKLLRAHASDNPWALLIGLYTFRPTLGDLRTLGRLGKIGSALGAPFLAGAAPDFVGCDSFGAHPDPQDWTRRMSEEVQETWHAVRKLPEASSLGLALPRFLLRQPYGQRSEPIDGFPFEELPDGSAHEAYLWGNPAILCGFVLADAFQAEGWEMQAEGSGEVGDLPVYKFTEEGETKVKPCAEAWLSEHGGDAILSQGLMPLLSIKGRDAVRLGELRSVSSSTSRLNGRWG